MNASLFIQIKQFSRREPKKKPVMSRKRLEPEPLALR